MAQAPVTNGSEQPGSLAAAPATLSPPAKTMPKRKNPLIDPATAIADDALLNALQKGGFVLYLRHAETGAAITEQCNTSNLSPNGAAVARELGAQLRQQRIPVGRIQSSPVCRVQETAKLLAMGDVELSDDLAQTAKAPVTDLYAARMRQLGTAPSQGTNTIVVSHMHGGGPPYQAMDLEFGEIIVFRPDGNGGAKAVARIPAEKWPALAATKTVSK